MLQSYHPNITRKLWACYEYVKNRVYQNKTAAGSREPAAVFKVKAVVLEVKLGLQSQAVAELAIVKVLGIADSAVAYAVVSG